MSLLETSRLTMKFGGLTAVDEVSMNIGEGSVHALIGPNGAGKSTFINMISGIYKPTSGKILFTDHDIQGRKANEFSRLGISRTFQNLRLFKNLSVLENILIGLNNGTKETFLQTIFATPRFRRTEKQSLEAAEQILHDIGLWERRDQQAKSLSYGQQKWLEMARALASHPKLLLLDEPAAGLNDTETASMEDFIRQLPNKGITVLVIEHDMHLVMRLAHTITVLNFGKQIAEGTPAEIQNDPVVVEAYLGKGLKHA